MLCVAAAFAAILLGMAISAWALGTGGRRSRALRDIYFSVEDCGGRGVLYTMTGEYSMVIEMENPVPKFSADADGYSQAARLFAALARTLGEGYALHKQDVFTRKGFHDGGRENGEFLSRTYFEHFEGRMYTDSRTYLTITQEARKSMLPSYDAGRWRDFLSRTGKVADLLRSSGVGARFLTRDECRDLVDRFFALDFAREGFPMNSFSVSDESIGMGDRRAKVFAVVDVDSVGLPATVRPCTVVDVDGSPLPMDFVSAVDTVPGADTVVYNQVVFMPNQKRELSLLDRKRNRHCSLPSPGNQVAAEDIRRVQEVAAREGRLLAYIHFNLVVCCPSTIDMQGPANHVENAFARMGIHVSRRAYNQLELFVGSFPGNCYGLSADYDRFLTLADAAACLFYKERAARGEDTPLKVHYTDRRGVPIAIDITGKEGRVKMTDNSNFFCLGPSGSGKSFHINSVVRQLHEQGTDVVMVDTGNSYEGLCEYLGGKYISYTDEKPITMNPFRVRREDLNIEKVDFLKNLVLQVWKGSDQVPTDLEARTAEQMVGEYYDAYFRGFDGYTGTQRAAIERNLRAAARRRPDAAAPPDAVPRALMELEGRRRALKVGELSFNSFYEYSTEALDIICRENDISGIDVPKYAYMMRPFYRGGQFERTLNEQVDTTLFDETFIVFEVDAIKDSRMLFPIVTLVIMDVFLQKMRLKGNRKVLVIEEAWKAIATPLMAEYIKYLYKTVRKFRGMVGVVTQELGDIVGSGIVREAIINNSDVVMLLDQSKFRERFGEIREVLGLTEVDCRKIFTINRLDNKAGRPYFKEVFIRRGTVSDVYGVEESRECYMTYTTERAEKEALGLYRRELGCSHRDAIKAYVRDWDLSGIAGPYPFAMEVHGAGRVLGLAEVGRARVDPGSRGTDGLAEVGHARMDSGSRGTDGLDEVDKARVDYGSNGTGGLAEVDKARMDSGPRGTGGLAEVDKARVDPGSRGTDGQEGGA